MLGRLNLFTVDVSRCHLPRRTLARVLDNPEVDAAIQAVVDVGDSTCMVEFRSACTDETLKRVIHEELGAKGRYARVYRHDE